MGSPWPCLPDISSSSSHYYHQYLHPQALPQAHRHHNNERIISYAYATVEPDSEFPEYPDSSGVSHSNWTPEGRGRPRNYSQYDPYRQGYGDSPLPHSQSVQFSHSSHHRYLHNLNHDAQGYSDNWRRHNSSGSTHLHHLHSPVVRSNSKANKRQQWSSFNNVGSSPNKITDAYALSAGLRKRIKALRYHEISEESTLQLNQIPSWHRYFNDRKHQIVKFSDDCNNESIQHNHLLNSRVSLNFYKKISKISVDAVVSSTSENYGGVSGVDKFLHQEAGKELAEACKALEKCSLGHTEITEGFLLAARYIIWVNGPDSQMESENRDEMLQTCYKNCLDLLIKKKLRSIAFPCISTGRKGIPKDVAAKVALSTVRSFLEAHHDQVDRVVFCLHNKKDIDIYVRLMQVYFPVE